jgi:uncharacterized RDD family membrane protein YckC
VTNYASPPQRFGAWVLDAVIAYLVIGLPAMLIFGYDPKDPGFQPSEIVALLGVFGYLVAFDAGKRGATPGKRLVGTRVVDAEEGNSPIGYRRAAVRRLGYIVGWACLLLGWLWLIWDPRHQAWHDKFADTVVVTGD